MIKEFFKTILYTPLFNLLVLFAWLTPGDSIGWGIIFVTIFVKLALWVPSAKAIRSPIQMSQYRDDIKEIQDKHKGDKAAQSKATMAFYKEKGINPLAGCLPLLIQLPVLIILYRVFIVGLGDFRGDLLYSFMPQIDSINIYFFGLNLSEPSMIIMPLIAAGFQFAQSKHMMILNPPPKNSKDPAANMQKQMLYMFPVITFFIARSFPAGLALYWATNAILSTIQQEVIRRTYQPEKPDVKIVVRSKKNQ